MSPPNIYEPDFEDADKPEGFRFRRARLGRDAGARELGLALFEVPPGEAAYPYHFHADNEELIVVVSGRPTMRGPDGWRELAEGDVVSFPSGEEGGHQLVNRTEDTVRFLAISTQRADICVYPDSGKVGVVERRAEGGGMRKLFRLDDTVDYWEGEEPP